MGGRPITAMAIAGMPNDLPLDVISEIFKGGADKVKEAGCSLVGGHTIKNPEPIYGLSVTGTVSPQHFFSNDKLKDGDVLLLTKPLGTGIASSALKQGISSNELQQLSVESMVKLNTVGAILGEKKLAHACTDITGFGLIGHLWEMCVASGMNATLHAAKIPAISEEIYTLIDSGCVPGGTKANLASTEQHVKFGDHVKDNVKYLLADAQTAGGLLISCSLDDKKEIIDILNQGNSLCAEEIGRCYSKENSIGIEVN